MIWTSTVRRLPSIPTAVATSEPILALSGITKTFPGVRALSDVSLALYPGQVTALVGENGAGKSTIVKILTGIYQPTEGTISVDATGTTTVQEVPYADRYQIVCGAGGPGPARCPAGC